MGTPAGYIAAILRRVSGFRLFSYLCLLLLLNAVFSRNVTAKETADFSGSWVLRLGNRPLIVVTLAPPSPSGDTGPFAGSLVRPRFSFVSGSDTIFKIKGPDVRYTIIRTEIKESCLVFTTQNPANKSDEDNYRLCLSGNGQGTLGYDMPSIKPWPVTLEKLPPAVASDWESRQYSFDDSDISNSEMQQICEADKKDRQLPYEKIDWSVVVKADAARKEATRKLLAEGKLHTGTDFECAALIFQHSDAPDDYLLAHSLALVAIARGQASATFIAAETLDRYLQSIHQSQIYGTQTDVEHMPVTQEPYNRGLISDALRRLLDVPTQDEQEKLRKQYESERPHQ